MSAGDRAGEFCFAAKPLAATVRRRGVQLFDDVFRGPLRRFAAARIANGRIDAAMQYRSDQPFIVARRAAIFNDRRCDAKDGHRVELWLTCAEFGESPLVSATQARQLEPNHCRH